MSQSYLGSYVMLCVILYLKEFCNSFICGNASDKNNLYPGGGEFFSFLIHLIEILKYQIKFALKELL